MVEFEGKVYDTVHGGPFDRGSADSYYGRTPNPHYWPEGTGNGIRVEKIDMTPEEIEAYYAGFNENEQFGERKNWGW